MYKSHKNLSNFSFPLYYTFFVTVYRGVFRTWSNIPMEFFEKVTNGFFKLLTIFAKMFHCRFLTGLNIDFWLRAWNIELTLVLSLQIKPKKYSARKYVWHCFWKGEGSWRGSKQNERLWWSSRPKGSLKKDVMRNFAESTRKHLCQNLFFGVFLWVLWNL